MEYEKDYWGSRRRITRGVGEGLLVEKEKDYLWDRRRITGGVGEGLLGE